MSLYLNKSNDNLKKDLNSQIYVDKSTLISKANALFGSRDSFLCVSRPRRFGKTMAISMLNAYYSKGCDSKSLFEGLAISKDPSFEKHLNKHNVIWIDMASLYTGVNDKNIFVAELKREIITDLKEAFPSSLTENDDTVRKCITKINSNLGERFIFLIDEWDVLYREQEGNAELCDNYTELLRNLFKSSDVSACIDLVYMTGILPIRRYSTQSALNMFAEYNMLDSRNLSEFVGFTEKEVKNLCSLYDRDFKEIKNWYDGYHLNGIELYNPKSVVEAISRGKCRDYWVQTSALEAITNYMNYDNGVLKDAICKMVSGDKVPVRVNRFENDLTKITSPDAALTVLIHLGYLAYDEEEESCYIPNYEIREEFVKALEKLNWIEIYNSISNSKKLYEEALKGNVKFIDETLDKNHVDLAGPFNKNKEDVLGIIVQISYYWMRCCYDVRKEEASILGRSDISFVPRDGTHIPFIVELKIGSSPREAIGQIKKRRYFDSLGDYKGKVLLLGISYNPKTLKHSSKIEFLTI